MTRLDAPQEGASSPLGYRPQIDTLRAVAVGSVMFEHYLPWVFQRLGLMDGVMVFFAISGFLITGILLKYKDEVAGQQGGVRRAFGTFYARRALRIFPAYYVLLLILLITGRVQETFLWHATYTTNVWTALNGRWDMAAGHFWSLAVEEQFYLLWPLVIFSLPKRVLPWVMAAGIVLGIVFRMCALAFDWGLAIIVMPMANFDALFGGGLLAWAHHANQGRWLAVLRKYGLWSFLAVPLLYAGFEQFNAIFSTTFVALMSVYVIDQCSKGYRGWLGWLFSIPLVLYLGKISYGLYLYHYVVRLYIDEAAFAFAGEYALYARAVAWGLAAVGCAMTSWHLLEKPINALKGRFQLGASAANAGAPIRTAN
ncbi:MAG: acyltransferase [Terricaulis sp.]